MITEDGVGVLDEVGGDDGDGFLEGSKTTDDLKS